MEVILLQDIEKLGSKHDLVEVKPGYGRNYLIPNGLAQVANQGNINARSQRIKKQEAADAKQLEEYQAIANKLSDQVITVGAKTGKEDKIFGTITTLQLAEAIKKQQSIEVDRRKLTFTEEIKRLGSYKANLELHPEIQVQISFEVVAE